LLFDCWNHFDIDFVGTAITSRRREWLISLEAPDGPTRTSVVIKTALLAQLGQLKVALRKSVLVRTDCASVERRVAKELGLSWGPCMAYLGHTAGKHFGRALKRSCQFDLLDLLDKATRWWTRPKWSALQQKGRGGSSRVVAALRRDDGLGAEQEVAVATGIRWLTLKNAPYSMLYYQRNIERIQAAEAASPADFRTLDPLFILMLRVIYPFISVMHELTLALEPESRETAFVSCALLCNMRRQLRVELTTVQTRTLLSVRARLQPRSLMLRRWRTRWRPASTRASRRWTRGRGSTSGRTRS
jgi:hypothetical protein